MDSKVAVVTMVYNEPHFLPLWIRYYSKQFGEKACYVVDHGSSDGTTANLGEVNVIRIPRSPKHNEKRARFISEFCSALLEWYNVVIHADVDEFLIPDPEQYGSLHEYCTSTACPVTTTIGLNVHNVPGDPQLDLSQPILKQRRWARFEFAMCKPLITTEPISWTPGFHYSNKATKFDRVFLFHLHHHDVGVALSRLNKTRAMPWGDAGPDHHQLWPDERYQSMIASISRLKKTDSATLRSDDSIIGRYTDWISSYIQENPTTASVFYWKNGIDVAELIRIPERFLEIV